MILELCAPSFPMARGVFRRIPFFVDDSCRLHLLRFGNASPRRPIGFQQRQGALGSFGASGRRMTFHRRSSCGPFSIGHKQPDSLGPNREEN